MTPGCSAQELFNEKTREHWHWVAESAPEKKQASVCCSPARLLVTAAARLLLTAAPHLRLTALHTYASLQLHSCASLQANLDVIEGLVQNMRGLQADSTGALEQCMECEHQKEQQKELEQQTEMEKYVDVAYSRDGEAPTPWLFDELRQQQGPSTFYPASSFKLHRRKPLRICTRAGGEEDVHVSSNCKTLPLKLIPCAVADALLPTQARFLPLRRL